MGPGHRSKIGQRGRQAATRALFYRSMPTHAPISRQFLHTSQSRQYPHPGIKDYAAMLLHSLLYALWPRVTPRLLLWVAGIIYYFLGNKNDLRGGSNPLKVSHLGEEITNCGKSGDARSGAVAERSAWGTRRGPLRGRLGPADAVSRRQGVPTRSLRLTRSQSAFCGIAQGGALHQNSARSRRVAEGCLSGG